MENIIYYIFLFILVISIRFFKLKNIYKDEFNKKWSEVFFSSLEIVYTASGVVIALLLNVSKAWIAPVVIVYLVIVIFSALLEMSNENFNNKTKTGLHIGIIIIVVAATIITYDEVIPKVDINGKPTPVNIKNNIALKQYTIIIPYFDYSLIRHVGNKKLKNTPLTFQTNIITENKNAVYNLALEKIRKEKLLSPLFPDNSLNQIQILQEQIIIIETKKLKECLAF
ncbi:hypothetical protein [uncultured Flavobacterium sp.]|uniref:hypothetical protein n=1 Tax=uncultured Flavobacterium sp. TaxID=165435 RepID=UPI0026181117|nr:hypothetical protein [uncultured Flavobacterium sp.]